MKPTVVIHYREDGEVEISATTGIRIFEIDDNDEVEKVHEFENQDEEVYIRALLDAYDIEHETETVLRRPPHA